MNRSPARRTLLLAFLLLACGSDQKPDAAQTVVQLDQPSLDSSTPAPALDSLPPPTHQDTIVPVLLATGREFGTTEREIRHFLGAPDRVTAEPFQNQHDATKTDTILRLYYRDLTLALYRVTESRVDILLQVILSRAGRRIPFGLDIGTRREDVVAIQAPTREGLDDEGLETLEYEGPMEHPGIVRFVLRRDRVHRIEWSYFID
jgi:hypothetical protein